MACWKISDLVRWFSIKRHPFTSIYGGCFHIFRIFLWFSHETLIFVDFRARHLWFRVDLLGFPHGFPISQLGSQVVPERHVLEVGDGARAENERSLCGPELQEHEPMQAMKNNTPCDEHKNEILSWDRGSSFFPESAPTCSYWDCRTIFLQIECSKDSNAFKHVWDMIWLNPGLKLLHPHVLFTKTWKTVAACDMLYVLCSMVHG